MPIYEYQALNAAGYCPRCRNPFEALQRVDDPPLTVCPQCLAAVRRIVSRCHAAVLESSPEHSAVEKTVTEHEKSGRWSHAAELADKQAEKTKDSSLRNRALENYKKAGY